MKAVSTAASTLRHTFGVAFEALLILAIVGALIFGAASLAGIHPAGADSVFAAKGGNHGGNSDNATVGNLTVVANPSPAVVGEYYTISGTGYEPGAALQIRFTTDTAYGMFLGSADAVGSFSFVNRSWSPESITFEVWQDKGSWTFGASTSLSVIP